MTRVQFVLSGCAIAAVSLTAVSIATPASSRSTHQDNKPTTVAALATNFEKLDKISRPGAPAVMPIISRGVPAFASPNIQPNSSPNYANDNNYNTHYRSDGLPAWIAYDLSSVPPKHRRKVLAVYYNCSYTYDTINNPHYNNLGNYIIQGNPAPGSNSPPENGWITLVSVQGNTLHSRQHIFNLHKYNWVRIYVTRSDGAFQNYDADFNQFDIYDLSRVKKPTDDWIFYGDSITAGAMVTCPDAGVGPFAELIHQVDPRRWPVAENGGEPYDTSTSAVAHIRGKILSDNGTGYLSIFPGKYVALCYGMNDAGSPSNGRDFYNNMKAAVRAVLAAKKIPIIPLISYTNNAAYNKQSPILNAKIKTLYKQYRMIVRGPDFWTYFQQHPDLIAAGGIHPTALGYAAMRRLWATTMLREVYRR